MHKALYVPAIIAVLFSIYVLAKWQNLTSLALVAYDEKKQIGRFTKLDRPYTSMSATVLNVTGQFLAVQEVDSPCTISLVYAKGNLPTGLTPGKTVMIQGKFNNGLFKTDNVTITGGTPSIALDTPSQPVGMIDHIIFFIAYGLL